MKKSINFFILIILIFSCFSLLKVKECSAGASNKDCPQGEVCITNPLGSIDSPQAFIGQIIKGVLGVVGSLALIMFVYGGFLWMTAAGNSDAVEKGKGVLIWATIGLIVIFTSYALVNFVIGDLIGARGTPASQTK